MTTTRATKTCSATSQTNTAQTASGTARTRSSSEGASPTETPNSKPIESTATSTGKPAYLRVCRGVHLSWDASAGGWGLQRNGVFIALFPDGGAYIDVGDKRKTTLNTKCSNVHAALLHLIDALYETSLIDVVSVEEHEQETELQT